MSLFKNKILKDIESRQGLIVDTHTHIGVSLNRYVKNCGQFCQSLEELEMKMKKHGVDYSIIFPFPELNGNGVRDIYINARHGHFEAEEFPYQLANNYIFSEVIRKDFQSFIPFMLIHPCDQLKPQLDMFNKFKDYIFGFKIHTTANEISPINIPEEFANTCIEYKLPILFHTRACQEEYNCWSVVKFAMKHPEINVCVAHCAGFDKHFFKEIHNFQNVYFDVSPLLSLCYLADNGNDKIISKDRLDFDYKNINEVFSSLFELAPSKLLWATDEPCGHNIPDKYHLQIETIKNCDNIIKSRIQKNVYNFLTNLNHEDI